VTWSRLFHRGAESAPADPIAPKRLGLALGGGGVRGAAHLGVFSVLEREGIKPDVVAGTSVGALVGAGIAGGVSSAEMLRYFREARWKRIARPSWRSKLSMLDANPLGELLTRITSAQTIADLALPFAAVACDILTGARVVITEGSLSEAVVASSAIPALFEPVRGRGHLLVDGSLVDNLPVDAARSLGADYVIAVDIMPPLDGTYEPTDARETLLLTWNIVQREAETGREDADLVITPDVVRVSLSDFSQVQEAYDAGVAAAEAALPALLEDLGRRGGAGSRPLEEA
jgi:NTE family protein